MRVNVTVGVAEMSYMLIRFWWKKQNMRIRIYVILGQFRGPYIFRYCTFMQETKIDTPKSVYKYVKQKWLQNR